MDNYLIYLIQSCNIEALNLLVEKYRKYIPLWVTDLISLYSSYPKDIDLELIISDVEITLYKMIENYEPSKGVFYSYLKGAVSNIVMNHVRKSQRNYFNSLSLEYEFEEGVTLLDCLSSKDNISRIEERFYMIEEVNEFNEKVNSFKAIEKKILYMKMQGYPSEEIANSTNTSIRKVNYLLNKVRKL